LVMLLLDTNRGSLLEVAVIGEITHTVVEGLYMTDWEGRPMVGVGRGGIVYNVKLGDPCFGWAWGEKAEPGASADGLGEDQEKASFRNLTCIGNEARVTDGEAKGERGIVVGKVGYLDSWRGHHVVIHFEDGALEKLAIGDKVQVKARGVGLQLSNFGGVRVISVSPDLLESMGLEEKGNKLIVPVTKVVPAYLVGQGSGGAPSEAHNWDVQTQSPDAVSELRGLRLGDVVMLDDILSAWGRGYFEGAATVGVVSCGASRRMGQGIGVTTVLTGRGGELEPRLDPEANIGRYLGIGRWKR